MTELYIPTEVVDKNGRRAIVTSIHISDGTEGHDIKLENFLETYTEYVDPKDFEIARLKQELADLKAKHKQPRRARRKLTKGEIKEIEEHIRLGEGNTPIAKEYDVSDTTVSKIRVRMRKGGEDV